MAEVRDRLASRRWWLNVIIAGVLLVGCDLNPVVGDGRSPGRQRRPVETVTALEIDTGELPVGDAAAARRPSIQTDSR